MSMFLIDNNIWSAHEKGYPDVVLFINHCITNEEKLCMSRIIQMELLSFYEIDLKPDIKANRESYIQDLAEGNIVEETDAVFLLAAEIRRKAKNAGRSTPKSPDALIAATAIENKLTLVSNNDKDFIWINEHYKLSYINPVKNKEHYAAFSKEFEENKRK